MLIRRLGLVEGLPLALRLHRKLTWREKLLPKLLRQQVSGLWRAYCQAKTELASWGFEPPVFSWRHGQHVSNAVYQ